jgi:hypothetical protein
LIISTNVPITAIDDPSHQRNRGQAAPINDANRPVTIGMRARMSPACAAVVRPMPVLSNVGHIAKLVSPETTRSIRSRPVAGNGSRSANASATAIGPAIIERRTPVVTASIDDTANFVATGVAPQNKIAKKVTP